MKRSYLFVYSDTLGTRDQVKEIINSTPEITHWRYDLPNSFYLISESDAPYLATSIRELSNEKGKFIITEIPANNKYGWLTSKSWYLINNKKYKKD